MTEQHMRFTKTEVENMDRETAMVEILEAVYEATKLFEQLSDAGKIHSNASDMRQIVANKAKQLIKDRWLIGGIKR